MELLQKYAKTGKRGQPITWILHESEAFIGKASKGDVVVLYFEPLATQHMKASGSPEGGKLMRQIPSLSFLSIWY